MQRFILFYNKRHPAEMGATEIRAFLTHLTRNRNVSASTQNQALSAILFLCRQVLNREIEPILLSIAKRPERLPTVLTRQELLCLLEHLQGAYVTHLLQSGYDILTVVRAHGRAPLPAIKTCGRP